MVLTPTDPTKPEVWIRGTAPNQFLDVYLPQGPKGDPGGLSATRLGVDYDLDLVLTSGLYEISTPSNYGLAHMPLAEAGSLFVTPSTAGGVIIQTFISNTKGMYVRRRFSSAWSSWRHYGPSRTDQTAGRAMYSWDEVNMREQLVWGDTGWRDVTSNLLNGATATSLQVRRVLNNLYLKMNTLQLPSTSVNDSFYTPPVGFQSNFSEYSFVRETINTGLGFGFVYGGDVKQYGIIATGANNTTHRFSGMLRGFTDQPWPTTLPGVAAGTIGNT